MLCRKFSQKKLSREAKYKCNFRNKITENFRNTSIFKTKSNCTPPNGHPALEMYLSQIEDYPFPILQGNTKSNNLSKMDRKAVRKLAENRILSLNQQIKCDACLYGKDQIIQQRLKVHLNDNITYKEVRLREEELVKFVEQNNNYV